MKNARLARAFLFLLVRDVAPGLRKLHFTHLVVRDAREQGASA